MKLLMNQLIELCGSILWTPDTYIRDKKIRQTTGTSISDRIFYFHFNKDNSIGT